MQLPIGCPPSNAKQMKEQALKSGIKADDILMDEFSTNTHENAQFSGDIIRRNNFQKIILVTSGYHQLRTNFEFKKALKVITFKLLIRQWKMTLIGQVFGG